MTYVIFAVAYMFVAGWVAGLIGVLGGAEAFPRYTGGYLQNHVEGEIDWGLPFLFGLVWPLSGPVLVGQWLGVSLAGDLKDRRLEAAARAAVKRKLLTEIEAENAAIRREIEAELDFDRRLGRVPLLGSDAHH